MSKPVIIYALLCPFTEEPRYVGKTVRKLTKRFNEHISNYGIDVNTFCGKWVNELRLFKYLPSVTILETCTESNWQERERHWIQEYRKLYPLLNMDGGGISSKYSSTGYNDHYRGNNNSYNRTVDEIKQEIRRHINTIEVMAMDIVPNENQQIALDYILNWCNNNNTPVELVEDERFKLDFENKLFCTLSGFAGTGKTTLLKLALKDIKARKIMITAPTHKAKKVAERMTGLQGKTIQKLLGLRPNMNIEEFDIDNILFEVGARSELQECDLVIVDECGMINEDLHKYIIDQAEKYNTKILFMGDELQLPPVKEVISHTFENSNYLKLTHIMRQSDTNPINNLLDALRNDIQNPGDKKFVEYILQTPVAHNEKGEGYRVTRNSDQFNSLLHSYFTSEDYLEDKESVKATAWTNVRVGELNTLIRRMIYGDRAQEQLIVGDVLMSYKTVSNGGSETLITNSEEYLVGEIGEDINHYDIPCLRVTLRSLDTDIKVGGIYIADKRSMSHFDNKVRTFYANAKKFRAWKPYFEFVDASLIMEGRKIEYNENGRSTPTIIPKSIDYGYALTVHKTQGSTYKSIFVDAKDIGKNQNIVEKRKLMYVALSRCSKDAILIV